MNLIQQDYIDIVFVQEPYLIQNKTAGITRTHRTYISDEDKSRAAIIIANDSIDAVLIKQLCDRDNVVVELRYKSTRTLAASMYLDQGFSKGVPRNFWTVPREKVLGKCEQIKKVLCITYLSSVTY
jgi:hypothetical protein